MEADVSTKWIQSIAVLLYEIFLEESITQHYFSARQNTCLYVFTYTPCLGEESEFSNLNGTNNRLENLLWRKYTKLLPLNLVNIINKVLCLITISISDRFIFAEWYGRRNLNSKCWKRHVCISFKTCFIITLWLNSFVVPVATVLSIMVLDCVFPTLQPEMELYLEEWVHSTNRIIYSGILFCQSLIWMQHWYLWNTLGRWQVHWHMVCSETVVSQPGF